MNSGIYKINFSICLRKVLLCEEVYIINQNDFDLCEDSCVRSVSLRMFLRKSPLQMALGLLTACYSTIGIQRRFPRSLQLRFSMKLSWTRNVGSRRRRWSCTCGSVPWKLGSRFSWLTMWATRARWVAHAFVTGWPFFRSSTSPPLIS